MMMRVGRNFVKYKKVAWAKMFLFQFLESCLRSGKIILKDKFLFVEINFNQILLEIYFLQLV